MATQALLNVFADFLPSTIASVPLDVPATASIISSNTSHPTPSSHSETRTDSFFSISSLFVSLVTRNQDVFKLIVIGGLIETYRRFFDRMWRWFLNTWYITAYFDNSDDTFSWMMVWLSKQNIWLKAREVHISTASFGQTHHKGVAIPEDENGLYNSNETGFQTKRKLSYLPAYGTKHYLKYKGKWMSVSRTRSEPMDPWSGRKEEMIEINLLTRDHSVLRSLLLDAKRAYKTEDQDTVEIYGADSYNQWNRTATRKKRPLRSIVLEPKVKDMILNDAKEFLSTEKWYTDRGIPYRRGYLLHGVPGSGKTSLIHSVAGELGLDIYVLSLAKKNLDDSDLNDLICQLPTRCIALMEDIDVAFHVATTREPDTAPPEGPTPPPPGPDSTKKGVTLSGLLNALDGVAAQEGRLLFATTNRYDSLDEALCRPGRMDVHVEFNKATRWQARELFRCFFMPPVSDADVEEETLEKEKETRYGPFQLTQRETDGLAEQFADAVPPGQFSMASLQGHLMRFKERPQEAVEAVAEWVQQESRKRGAHVKDTKDTKDAKDAKDEEEGH